MASVPDAFVHRSEATEAFVDAVDYRSPVEISLEEDYLNGVGEERPTARQPSYRHYQATEGSWHILEAFKGPA